MRAIYAIVSFFAVVVLMGHSREKPVPQTVKPCVTLYGRNSKIEKEKILRITSENDWKALWMEHKTGSANPKNVTTDLEYAEMDFTKVMVIAIFEGKSVNCRGFSSDSINETESEIRIRIQAHTYQSGDDTPPTQAWGILVLPRSGKEVILEHDVRGVITDPPKWEEWKRIPATKR